MKIKTSNEFINGVFTLGFGTILAQLINVIAQLLMTRLVDPSELGVYTYIISLAQLIVPIASLKLEMLIITEKSDLEAQYITDTSIILTVLVSVVYLIVLFSMKALGFSSINVVGNLIYAIPIIVLLNGIRYIFDSYNNRYKDYSLISKINILRESTISIFQIVLSVLSFGAIGLTVGYSMGPLIGLKKQSILYVANFRHRIRINVNKFIDVLKSNRSHVIYMVPGQFINTFSYTLIILFVTAHYSTLQVGLYSLTTRILTLPLVLIAMNVNKIFLKQLSEVVYYKKSTWITFKKTVFYLTITSGTIFFLIGLFAPILTSVLFGSAYYTAGNYMRIFCFMYALRFVTSSMVGTYIIFNKQQVDVVFQIVLVLMGGIISFLAKKLNLNIETYFALISFFYGLTYIINLLNMGWITKKQSKILLEELND